MIRKRHWSGLTVAAAVGLTACCCSCCCFLLLGGGVSSWSLAFYPGPCSKRVQTRSHERRRLYFQSEATNSHHGNDDNNKNLFNSPPPPVSSPLPAALEAAADDGASPSLTGRSNSSSNGSRLPPTTTIPLEQGRNSDAAATLWSYVSNLQRTRRPLLEKSSSDSHKNATGFVSRSSSSGLHLEQRSEFLKTARSLAHFLETHGYDPISFSAADDDDDGMSRSRSSSKRPVEEPLQRALVQAVRGVADTTTNDYRLILQLFRGAQRFAANQQQHAGILDPRIAGETIAALGRTKHVNMNKIRSVWHQVCASSSNSTTGSLLPSYGCWTRRVGPLEVNAMLQVMVARGKLRAALDLFYKEHESGATDAYSGSILLNALATSLPSSSMVLLSSNTDTPATTTFPEKLHPPPTMPNLVNVDLVPMISTWCWQWNAALVVLDRCILSHDRNNHSDTDNPVRYMNNPLITAFLQLNQRLASLGTTNEESRPISKRVVPWLISFMQRRHILPDHVTSTLLLAGLNSWEHAVELLLQSSSNSRFGNDTSWRLPSPNVYMYSAAMAVCARNRQYNATMGLLNDMYQLSNNNNRRLENSAFHAIKPNVVVYNSVFQALTTSRTLRPKRGKIVKHKLSTRKRAKERLTTALALFERMSVAPDIVTFNTLLAVVAGNAPLVMGPSSDCEDELAFLIAPFPYLQSSLGTDLNDHPIKSSLERLVMTLLRNMQHNNVLPDLISVNHALHSFRIIDGGDAAIRLVSEIASKPNIKKHLNMMDVYIACFSVIAELGDIESAVQLLSFIRQEGYTELNSETVTYIVTALGQCDRSSALYEFFQGELLLGVPHRMTLPPLNAIHFALAISSCLRVSDFEGARALLLQMKTSGVHPTDSSLEKIARAYSILALEGSSSTAACPKEDISARASSRATRARSAFAIFSSIHRPSVELTILLARACCSSGMISESQSLLRTLHKTILQSRSEMVANSNVGSSQKNFVNDAEKNIPALHRDLLQFCADQGNVTNALRLCEDIQYLSSQLVTTTSTGYDSSLPSSLSIQPSRNPINVEVDLLKSYGMTSSCWKSLIVAASKSGHWRVCLSSLQFLRPYVEASHPVKARNKEHLILLSRSYRKLESTVNTVVRCLALRGQYGWIVRVIDDWIEWCGRRPPREAALAAVRILAARGRGEEVNSLLARCTSKMVPCHTNYFDTSYKQGLFVGAISALYNEGLYDDADDAFVAAISQQALPFNLAQKAIDGVKRITLDLHGMNVAVAHSAVRIALQQEATTAWSSKEPSIDDFIIVTGRGLNSALKMRPVLRPTVQRMLVEEFYPPLSTTSVPGNMGAIRISPVDISQWLMHQRRQKGTRLLMVAAMLKDIASPGNRLRAALAKALPFDEA